MPLRFQFKKIFEKDDCLEKVLALIWTLLKNPQIIQILYNQSYGNKKSYCIQMEH